MEDNFWDNTPDLELPKFEQPKNPCVEWVRPRCPNKNCNSVNIRVTNSQHIPLRYVKCLDCGLNFTTYEVNYEQK